MEEPLQPQSPGAIVLVRMPAAVPGGGMYGGTVIVCTHEPPKVEHIEPANSSNVHSDVAKSIAGH